MHAEIFTPDVSYKFWWIKYTWQLCFFLIWYKNWLVLEHDTYQYMMCTLHYSITVSAKFIQLILNSIHYSIVIGTVTVS